MDYVSVKKVGEDNYVIKKSVRIIVKETVDVSMEYVIVNQDIKVKIARKNIV